MDVKDLVRSIQSDPGDDWAWRTLFHGLADLPDGASALALLTSRHHSRRDAGAWTFGRVVDLATRGDWATLERLYESAGSSSPFRGLFAFGLALGAARRFDLDETVPRLREAAFVTAFACRQVFAHEPELCSGILGQMLQQANLAEDRAFGSTETEPEESALPDLTPEGPLFMAACCETYFEAYGERFIRSLSARLPGAWFLIHVMNPGGEGPATRARLRREFPRGGFSTEAGRSDASWYASRRFTLCRAARTRYRGDLVVMDVDSVFQEGFAALLDRSRGADVAYIGNAAQLSPSLIVSAAHVFLRGGGPVADALVGHCDRYLRAKLGEPAAPWTVDQAALWRALCLLAEDRKRAVDLAATIPNALDRIVATGGHVIDQGERLARRSNREEFPYHFDQNRRPVFQ